MNSSSELPPSSPRFDTTSESQERQSAHRTGSVRHVRVVRLYRPYLTPQALSVYPLFNPAGHPIHPGSPSRLIAQGPIITHYHSYRLVRIFDRPPIAMNNPQGISRSGGVITFRPDSEGSHPGIKIKDVLPGNASLYRPLDRPFARSSQTDITLMIKWRGQPDRTKTVDLANGNITRRELALAASELVQSFLTSHRPPQPSRSGVSMIAKIDAAVLKCIYSADGKTWHPRFGPGE